MADITPLIRSDQMVIQAYAGGQFRVSGTNYDHPVFIFPDRVEPWQTDATAEIVSPDDFKALFDKADDLDVVLWGCGDRTVFHPPSFRMALKQKGLILEVMDTGAACRTYNVLLSEGRRVVAALLPVSPKE